MSSCRLVKVSVIKTIVRYLQTTVPRRPLSKTNYLVTPLEVHGICPDLLDKAPELEITVRYASGVSVQLGNVLQPCQTKIAPSCIKWEHDKKCFYTLYMCDLDSPSRKSHKNREWQHWLVTNIPGCKVCHGTLLTAYVGPWPQEETGLHRYVFLVYRQKKCENFNKESRLSERSAKGRSCFDIKHFANQYCMCGPLAINFFMAAYDSCVPPIMEMLRVQ